MNSPSRSSLFCQRSCRVRASCRPGWSRLTWAAKERLWSPPLIAGLTSDPSLGSQIQGKPPQEGRAPKGMISASPLLSHAAALSAPILDGQAQLPPTFEGHSDQGWLLLHVKRQPQHRLPSAACDFAALGRFGMHVPRERGSVTIRGFPHCATAPPTLVPFLLSVSFDKIGTLGFRPCSSACVRPSYAKPVLQRNKTSIDSLHRGQDSGGVSSSSFLHCRQRQRSPPQLLFCGMRVIVQRLVFSRDSLIRWPQLRSRIGTFFRFPCILLALCSTLRLYVVSADLIPQPLFSLVDLPEALLLSCSVLGRVLRLCLFELTAFFSLIGAALVSPNRLYLSILSASPLSLCFRLPSRQEQWRR